VNHSCPKSDVETWQKTAAAEGRHLCLPGTPYQRERGGRSMHPLAERIGTCDEGCCDRYRCPICGLSWLKELPQ
jgi:hypothetical protein